MNKQKLQVQLLEKQRQIIGEIKEKILATMIAANLDESDTIDPEDLSHQSEENTLNLLFQQQLTQAEKEMQMLEKIDFSAKKIAELGALVETDDVCFFVGYPVIPFDFEGKRIVGVSATSPIMSAMNKKKSGDTFIHGEKEYKINTIY